MQGIEILDKLRTGLPEYEWNNDVETKADLIHKDLEKTGFKFLNSDITDKGHWDTYVRKPTHIKTLDENDIELSQAAFAYLVDHGTKKRAPRITGIKVNELDNIFEFKDTVKTVNNKIINQSFLSYPFRGWNEKSLVDAGFKSAMGSIIIGGIATVYISLSKEPLVTFDMDVVKTIIGTGILSLGSQASLMMLGKHFDNVRYNAIPKDARENYLFGKDTFKSLDEELIIIQNNDKKMQAFDVYAKNFGKMIAKGDFSTAYDIISGKKSISEKILDVKDAMSSSTKQKPSIEELSGLFKVYESINK